MPSTSEVLHDRLRDAKRSLWFPMPPASDIVMCHPSAEKLDGENKEIESIFGQYFALGHGGGDDVGSNLPTPVPTFDIPATLANCFKPEPFPLGSTFADSCVRLGGTRGAPRNPETGEGPQPLRRLFVGDIVWLFFMERMGVFQMQGAILDDFARKGKYPLPSSDVRGIVLEAMVRMTKVGLSSTLRDRDSSYRRCLGWTIESARSLGSDAVVNSAFNDGFHRFLQLALKLYRDKRLASLFPAASGSPPVRMSSSTLKAIAETLEPLKVAMDAFTYGRNYTHTLTGIVWAIGSLLLIRDIRSSLGIPPEYSGAARYIPSAYNVLVGNAGTAPNGQGNRFLLHRECAVLGRDIVLDLEVLNPNDPAELEAWLGLVEDRIEGYATAYQALTGVDLGGEKTPVDSIRVEQQV